MNRSHRGPFVRQHTSTNKHRDTKTRLLVVVAALVAAVAMRAGDVVESGIVRRLTNVDGDVNPLENAEDWFAQVGAMDMVISIDNSTIQVSGSQGVPTWTLLNYMPEWRFGMAGAGHDWHPSLRVYRQPAPGDWRAVFDAVGADFADWLAVSQEGASGDFL